MIAGHDAVVCAVTDRSTDDRSMIPSAARSLLAACEQAGVGRLVFCGGGGSLEVSPGVRAVDEPDFPPQYLAEALAQAEALAFFRAADTSVEWTYASPPPHHLEPGEKGGDYHARVGDTPVVDAEGESRLTSGDYAVAIVYALTEHVCCSRPVHRRVPIGCSRSRRLPCRPAPPGAISVSPSG